MLNLNHDSFETFISFYIFVLLFLILARANKNTRAQNPALPPFAKSWRGGPGPPTLTGGPGADHRRARARARARAKYPGFSKLAFFVI